MYVSFDCTSGLDYKRGFPQGFKMRPLRRGFHILMMNVLFSSPVNVGSHNPALLGVQRSH